MSAFGGLFAGNWGSLSKRWNKLMARREIVGIAVITAMVWLVRLLVEMKKELR